MKNKKGFTFIEILVVVTIIGVLSAIGVVSYSSAQKKSRDGKRMSDLEAARSALEMYRSDNDVYPDDPNDLVPDYLGSLPEDPEAPDYRYRYNSDGSTYCLCVHLEGNAPGTSCDCDAINCGEGACNYSVQNP